MPVILYGQVAGMDEINLIAAEHKLRVIKDAAQSFGVEYTGTKSCNLSDIVCTSFPPSKPLGCYGDGAAIFTNDDKIAAVCREIRVHGQSQRFVHTRVAVDGRMDTQQCEIVLAKLKRFDWEIAQRQLIGQRYNQILAAGGIDLIALGRDCTSVYAQYIILVSDREELQKRLNEGGIPIAVHYPTPLNRQPAYKHLCCSDHTPDAQKAAKQVMSLPMGPDLLFAQQDKIVLALFR
jgi:UDP-2-acetamido-2-deoxy-ribo-hexuluronate aminotransferase